MCACPVNAALWRLVARPAAVCLFGLEPVAQETSILVPQEADEIGGPQRSQKKTYCYKPLTPVYWRGEIPASNNSLTASQ